MYISVYSISLFPFVVRSFCCPLHWHGSRNWKQKSSPHHAIAEWKKNLNRYLPLIILICYPSKQKAKNKMKNETARRDSLCSDPISFFDNACPLSNCYYFYSFNMSASNTLPVRSSTLHSTPPVNNTFHWICTENGFHHCVCVCSTVQISYNTFSIRTVIKRVCNPTT